MRPIFLLAAAAALASAQIPKTLTLAEAEAIAVKSHPRVSSALLNARAAAEVTRETNAARFPSLVSNFTAAGAQKDTATAAGALTTSSLISRAAAGVTASQLLYDFGRAGNLTRSAGLRADAQRETAQATRAQIVLQVRAAYFQALQAQSVLRVAQETVGARQLTLRQVTRLFESKLKSSLDLSFAEVNLSEAELLLFRAENDIKAALSELAAAMGQSAIEATLADEPMPAVLDPDPQSSVQQAMKRRPEVLSLRLQRDAAVQFARAERGLLFPTVSAIGAAGVIPAREDKLHGSYSGIGVNVSIPVLNGSLYSARRAEADLRAQAAAQDVRDLEIRIERDVKVAWLNTNNAFRRLDVTARLLEQANRSLRLAQSRYDLGLGSIVELNQAQLNKTSAEISGVSAKYEYQIQRAILDYQSGAIAP